MNRVRYNFVRNGQGSPWFELPEVQAEAAARKFFRVPIPLWKTLRRNKSIYRQTQVLQNGFWTRP
jgi:hypothetical protein